MASLWRAGVGEFLSFSQVSFHEFSQSMMPRLKRRLLFMTRSAHVVDDETMDTIYRDPDRVGLIFESCSDRLILNFECETLLAVVGLWRRLESRELRQLMLQNELKVDDEHCVRQMGALLADELNRTAESMGEYEALAITGIERSPLPGPDALMVEARCQVPQVTDSLIRLIGSQPGEVKWTRPVTKTALGLLETEEVSRRNLEDTLRSRGIVPRCAEDLDSLITMGLEGTVRALIISFAAEEPADSMARDIRRLTESQPLPFLVLLDGPDEARVKALAQSGARAIVARPFKDHDFIAKLTELVRRSSSGSAVHGIGPERS